MVFQQIGQEAARAFFQYFRHEASQLREVHMRHADLEDDVSRALVCRRHLGLHVLTTSQPVTRAMGELSQYLLMPCLIISRCLFAWPPCGFLQECNKFIEAITKHTCVETLDISRNYVGEPSMASHVQLLILPVQVVGKSP